MPAALPLLSGDGTLCIDRAAESAAASLEPPPVTQPKQPVAILIGHCGVDTTYLTRAIRKASPAARVESAFDQASLDALLAGAPDSLLLVNRRLDGGFAEEEGVDLIRRIRRTVPTARAMLVSNYGWAQSQAVEAGALPGFGKSELGQDRVIGMLGDALGQAPPAAGSALSA